MEVIVESSSLEKPESMRFLNSLQELRELRSQLHYAADYCETTFLKSQEKKEVMENTKEYICRALVTVVDHLGNVSANLEGLISQTNAFSEAQSRIQCLKLRSLSCEQYADKLALTKMRWKEKFPRFHARYLSSPPILERSSSQKLRGSEAESPSKIEDKTVVETHEELPLLIDTLKPHLAKNFKPTTDTIYQHNNLAKVLPVRDGLSVLTKVSNPTFYFQGTQKVTHHRRSLLQGSDILWLIRRTKRTK
ncbi:PREDICTED: probable protein ABIL5 [Lupinus angustifolius]|uniref:probable protein ABIL5 n=1 Tax=Lupinus angustifolius TaxID=3871 RepID=UPI00092F58E9|nr:PREDICTED: probable protein ABIL5 [Lupinus angustifolius]